MEYVILLLIALSAGLLVGLILGSLLEHKFGHASKEGLRYHKIILRMIPYLKRHYSDAAISNEMINEPNFNYRFDADIPFRREPPHENLP